MIVTTAALYRVAFGKFAVGGYNINNAEQTMRLFPGCITSQAPFILQVSKAVRKYTNLRTLEAIIRSFGEIIPEGVFAVDRDHGLKERCYKCFDSGFHSSVMTDAADAAAENVAVTAGGGAGAREPHQRGGRTRDARRRGGRLRPCWKDYCVRRFKQVEEVMAAFEGAVFAMARFAVGLSILWTIVSRH